jgi:hypothetical protein
MFKFVKTVEEVLSIISQNEAVAMTERLGTKEFYAFLVQEDVMENRVWAVALIEEPGKEKQYGLSCLNATGIPVMNMMYLDYYVEELRGCVIHIDQSYGRVAIINARTVSRSYADAGTVYTNRAWDGKGPHPVVDVHLITPQTCEDSDVVTLAQKKGVFVLGSDLDPVQIRKASAVLQVYRRLHCVESVVFEQGSSII